MDPNTNSGVKQQAEYDANIEIEATTSKKSQVTKAAVGVEKSGDMATNLNKGLKRQDKDEMKNVPSTSNKIQVNNSAVAAIVQANATYKHYGDNYINQQTQQQQSTPEHPPRGIELEVADPVASFRGRVEQLQHVKDAFNSPRNEKLNLVVVCGYGGIGKTEFARKFVQQHRADFNNCIWINAEFESTMNGSFGMLQEKLKNIGYKCVNLQEVYNYLNSDKSIFVFDNAENMSSIRSFLPQKSNDCLFLITSQFKNWSPYEPIPLDTLDLNSAINVIKVIFDKHKIEISESQVQTLVETFEHIPLVLQIGAGFVCQEILDLKTIGEYNIDNTSIIEALNTESDFVTQEFPVFSQDSYAKSVYKALSRTLDKIWTKPDKVSKLAAKILGISSYLSADDIEKSMLKELVEMKNENLFNKSLAILVQFSLLKISDSVLSMHRTVQECGRNYCVNQLKSNEYYSQALQILLLDYGFGYMHYNVLFQHGESYLETFCTYYDANKCRNLNRKLGKYISCQLLKHVLVKLGLIKNPEFLCEAVTREQDDIKQLLLEHRADFNVVDDQGFNTLYYACLSEDGYKVSIYNWNRIQTLIKIGADVNSINLEGNTVIHSLCNFEKTFMEKDESIFGTCALLIKFGGDPKIKNDAGQTPADLAREYGLALTRHLLDTVISGYPYILHIVAECRQFEFLHDLARDDVCDMNDRDNSGRTILHMLAGLAQLDAEDEVKLLYDTLDLLMFRNADVSVVNNAGETAADVARRCGWEKMADIFNGMDEPGRLILQTAALRDQLNHFQYVHSRSWEHANEQDDTGSTLLHALCGLDTRGDTELELDIVQLAADLVIQYDANVHIMNNAGATAADVARRHGRLLLADILNYDYCCFNSSLFSELMFFYLNHKQFSLLKYTWWRYCCLLFDCEEYFPVSAGIEVLHMLCSYEDPRVTDAELIRVFNDLGLKLVVKYESDEYCKAVGIAKRHGRDELFAWLKSTCDINERDYSGCTLLHRLSKDYGQYRVEFNEIVNLVVYCDADVSIVNNAGETAAGVARRRGWETLADFLNAWAPPARTIYQIDAHRSKLQQFTFVNNNNVQNVNHLDDTGSTLLHALCGLDTRGDPELELDIVKLAAHLVIRCDADVRIKNNAGATAADVAQRHDRLLLADFLHPSMNPTAFNLVSISVKLKQFELVKHAWWRYMYTTSHKDMYTSADQAGCRMLHILCEIEDLTVTDTELISLIHYLNLNLKQMAEYSNDFYNKVVTMARGNQRTELAAWLEKGDSSDSDTDTDTEDEDD